MTTSRFAILFVALLGLWRPGYASGEEVPATGLPPRCGICHPERIQKEPAPGAFNFLSLLEGVGSGDSGMCYSCHNGPVLDSRRSIWFGRQHPVGSWSSTAGRGVTVTCGTCHDPHVQIPGARPFMRYESSNSAYCLACHTGRGGGKKGEHPSPGGGSKMARGRGDPGCGSCHVVHRAAGEGLIRETSAEALCAQCHGENPSLAGKGPGLESHPVGGENPTCVVCHTVHWASSNWGLLKEEATGSFLCRECHEEHFSSGEREGNHPRVPERVECLSCHRAHNAISFQGRASLLALATEHNELCTGCHSSLISGTGEWSHPLGWQVSLEQGVRLGKLTAHGAYLGPEREVLCLSCHLVHGAQEGTPALVANTQSLCHYCQPAQTSQDPQLASRGHQPVSVAPRRAVIPDLFLEAGGETGDRGELTCVTCHSTHHGQPGTPGLVLEPKVYSCVLCHTDKAGMEATVHNLGLSRPREKKAPGEESFGSDVCRACHKEHGWTGAVGDLDIGATVIEKVCWSCHGPGKIASFTGTVHHPLGVSLEKRGSPEYLPLFWKDGRRLEKGLLSCATCHDVHRGSSRNFLRQGPDEDGGDLCLGCHQRQGSVAGTKHDLSLHFPNEKNRYGEEASKSGPCRACHATHGGGLGGSWARGINLLGGESDELSAFCTECHREGGIAHGKLVPRQSHSQSSLSRYPGQDVQPVGCGSCHDPHLWSAADPKEKGDILKPGDATTSFLVRSAGTGSELCVGCHPEQAAVAGTKHDLSLLRPEGMLSPGTGGEENGGLCGPCHRSHGEEPALLWPAPLTGSDSVRTETCLFCHAAGKMAAQSQVGRYTHPVGMSRRREARKSRLVFSLSLKRQSDDEISCGTCHDPHRWAPELGMESGDPATSEASSGTSFLRSPSDGPSPLCASCHEDKSTVIGTDHDLRVTAPDAVNLDSEETRRSGVCGACHKVHQAPNTFVLWNRPLGEGEDLPSRACRSCHSEGRTAAEKVPPRLSAHLVRYPGRGMVKRTFLSRRRSLLDLPQAFELYSTDGAKAQRGYLSCASCHDVHRWDPDVAGSGEGQPLEGDVENSFLRVRSTFAIERAFCRECHRNDTIERYRKYHFPD